MPLCFVIGPIGKDASSERKHSDLLLHAVIKEVLQQKEFGYTVKRADEDTDPGMIGDRLISDILNAELVVADLTDLNPNAFYELGIRHSTLKPTIHVARTGTPLPFDNISHRTIFVDLNDWQSITSARTRLADSVRAITAADFKVSNPITQANASFRMRQSADPSERVIAELQERLDAVESSLRATTAEAQITNVFAGIVGGKSAVAQEARMLAKNLTSAEDFAVSYRHLYPNASRGEAVALFGAINRGDMDLAAQIHASTAKLSIAAARAFLRDVRQLAVL